MYIYTDISSCSSWNSHVYLLKHKKTEHDGIQYNAANIHIRTNSRLRVAPEGALRENIFNNEESGRGAGRLARRRATPGGTTMTTQAEYDLVTVDILVLKPLHTLYNM